MKKLTKKIIGGVILTGGILLGTYVNNNGPVRNVRDIYQGYHNIGDGSQMLIFDEVELRNRDGAANIYIEGNPGNFKIGKKYNLEIQDKRWFGKSRLINSTAVN